MYDSFAVLFITLAQPAHPGSGEGRFDNSLQRNVVTSHPYMQSSGLKGAMKRGARSRGMTPTLVETIFGPDTPTASSAIALSDAQVLFFPVAASGNGTFLWTTSPSVLAELAVDLSYIEAGSGVVHAAVEGVAATSLQAGAEVGALWPNGCPSVVQDRLYPRDRAIVAAAANGGAQAQLGTLTSAIGGWALGHSAYFKGCFATQTAVVADEAFKRFTMSATQVETHVALGHSGTVENGPWDVEYLPRLTVLYSVVAFRSGSNQTAANLLQELEMQIAGRMQFTQVGGDATIGRGICRLKLVGTAEIVNWKQV